MIEINNLVKRYGDKKAVRGISFTVNDDEVLGFLGPNGAGKTHDTALLYLEGNSVQRHLRPILFFKILYIHDYI